MRCQTLEPMLVMRLGDQLEHLDVDDQEAVKLPNQTCPHKAGNSRRFGGVVRLLIRLSVGDIAHILLLVDAWLINPVSMTSPDAIWPDK